MMLDCGYRYVYMNSVGALKQLLVFDRKCYGTDDVCLYTYNKIEMRLNRESPLRTNLSLTYAI